MFAISKWTKSKHPEQAPLNLMQHQHHNLTLLSVSCSLKLCDCVWWGGRQVVANEVIANPQVYNEAFLGKPPQEYAKWIQDPSKWGGAIELSILSK